MYGSLRCVIHRAPLMLRGVHIVGRIQCFRPCQRHYEELMLKCPAFKVNFLHTSSNLEAGKLKNTKKKIIKKVRFHKKSIKSSWEVIEIRPNMTVSEVANAMGKDLDHVFEALLFIPGTDSYDSPSSVIRDIKVIKDILDKSGYRWKIEADKKAVKKENKDAVRRPPPDPSVLVKRAPVVTIMGHVDHGKTTLLDALRKSHIVDQEFGGITQHIGAFSVTLQTGDQITFLDTPGHAAFSAMRARGAQVTDIIVLVVAAEDGVMKQTVESIHHAKEAGVPLIVAVNKIDKFGANVNDTKEMLIQHGVEIEDDGGDVPVVPISALKRTNLDQLQETIVALSELLELKEDPTGLVEGAVIESRTDQGKGKVSTMIIQRGTLKKGCFLVAGKAWAKVRNILNNQGKPVPKAYPGEAVEVTGWKTLPSAGDIVLEVESEARVKEVLHWREQEESTRKDMLDYVHIKEKQEAHQREYEDLRQQRLAKGRRAGAIYGKMKTKEEVESYSGPELSIVLKGDVDGSVDAILDLLESYDQNLCRLSVLHHGVGIVSEHDVDMAALFSGHVYAFNVDVPPKTAQHADQVGVTIHSHNIIYKMVDDLKVELNKNVIPQEVEEIVGEASVLQNFTITESKKKVVVAGCRCNSGNLQRQKYFRIKRNGEIVGEGKISSMKHFKEEVPSVQSGQECGIAFDDQFIQPEAGDQVICFDIVEKKPEIKWELEF